MADMGLAAAMGNLAMPYTLRANCWSGACGGGGVPAASCAVAAVMAAGSIAAVVAVGAAALLKAAIELGADKRPSSGLKAVLGEAALLDGRAFLAGAFFLDFFLVGFTSLVLPSTAAVRLRRARRRTSPGVKLLSMPSSTALSVLTEEDEAASAAPGAPAMISF